MSQLIIEHYNFLVGMFSIFLGVLSFLRKEKWIKYLSKIRDEESPHSPLIYKLHVKNRTDGEIRKDANFVSLCFIIVGLIIFILEILK